MFVSKLKEGVLLKKLIESIKELVTDINLDITGAGVSLQAMDSSHVALVTLSLTSEGFEEYRCDKQMTLGVNILQLSKIMKCGGNEDSIILRAEVEPSALNIQFENKKQKKTSDFTLSLITIDSEHLGIPDTNYSSIVTMSSAEFTRICRELYSLSETVVIETNKSHIKFSVSSEVVGGSIKIDANDSNEKDELTEINVEEPVSLAFALRYLNMFTKASSLSQHVFFIFN
jgi:proliferating cell nuclear antigen